MEQPNRMLSESEVRKLIGDPKAVAADLRELKKSARVFSSNRERLLERFPQKWVAVYRGEVVANGDSLREVLRLVDNAGLPRKSVVVRYIDRNVRTLIL